jgi:uncharacterized protein YkwD
MLVAALIGWATQARDADRFSPIALARNVRLQGCRGHAGTRAPLHDIGGLSDAALDLARGSSLKAALTRAGYRDDRSTALHVSGDVAAVQRAFANQLCETVLDAHFSDFGAAQRGRDLWMIFAVPFNPPPSASSSRIDSEWLERINAARAHARRCGNRSFPAVPPLRANAQLQAAAQAHAHDMLEHNFFAHQGYDGSSPAQRVAATGYRFTIVGENIASGPSSVQEAVDGWIASPGHCENLMDPRFTQSGVAYAASTSGPARIYWVQEFAAPR